jgi:hypothetical protein
LRRWGTGLRAPVGTIGGRGTGVPGPGDVQVKVLTQSDPRWRVWHHSGVTRFLLHGSGGKDDDLSGHAARAGLGVEGRQLGERDAAGDFDG